jgi:DNA-binding transcriptional regulator GbsR (MarR family)
MGDSIKKYFDTDRDYSDWMEQRWTKNTTEDIKTDSVVESVISRFKERSAVGIDKYNTTLEDSTESFKAFLNHAQEEAMDFCLYLEKLKQMNDK